MEEISRIDNHSSNQINGKVPTDMPCLVCIYNEHEGGYLTVSRTYQAVSIDEDGWKIKDDSGDYNTYSNVYLMEYKQ